MTYGARLDEALKLAKTSRKALALAIGMSEQAIGMVIRGESKALTAENSAKAARALRVDHFWLATGDGDARPSVEGWPFHAISASDFYRLDETLREEVEDRLVGAVQRLARKESLGEMSSPYVAAGGGKK